MKTIRVICLTVALLASGFVLWPRASASIESQSLVNSDFGTKPIPGGWSGWMMTNEAFIEWRWKGNTYGSYIDPDCDFEFRATNGEKLNFRYEAEYDSSNSGSETKKGWAYGVTETETYKANVNRCTRVNDIEVSEVRRR
jgi:hypothetical protein